MTVKWATKKPLVRQQVAEKHLDNKKATVEELQLACQKQLIHQPAKEDTKLKKDLLRGTDCQPADGVALRGPPCQHTPACPSRTGSTDVSHVRL